MLNNGYVIIGASIAAIGCIEAIRENDTESKITVISNENHFIYSRPLISYMIQGKTNLENMRYRSDNFYKDNNVDLIADIKAIKINKEKKVVILENADNIPYDKLLIATGSSPFIPPITGADKIKNKFTFISLDEALKLQEKINHNSKVLILGAGLIGLKCAEAVNDIAKSVTVVDLSDRILPSILDNTGAEIIKKHIESNGVNFYLNNSISYINDNEATLKNGEQIPYDIFVIAVGVKPNTQIAKDTGIKVNKGIIINNKSKTSIPDIYAAGDCAESYDITRDENTILALLPNAYIQGHCAGVNMSGHEETFDNAIPMNSIGFFGLHLVTAGNYNGEEYKDETKDNYKKLFYKDNLLKGFIIIGDIRRAGIYTYLIREKIDIRKVDFELIKESPQLMAFSKKYRNEKLGGIIDEYSM